MRFTALGSMPAIRQNRNPSGGPAVFPMAMRQSGGGLISPRSQRESVMEEQWNFLANALWLRPSLARMSRIAFDHQGRGEVT